MAVTVKDDTCQVCGFPDWWVDNDCEACGCVPRCDCPCHDPAPRDASHGPAACVCGEA
jgi:hypothetical protein